MAMAQNDFGGLGSYITYFPGINQKKNKMLNFSYIKAQKLLILLKIALKSNSKKQHFLVYINQKNFKKVNLQYISKT